MRVVADRFELIERAGAGAMAEVYRAHDQVTHAPVALKILGRPSERSLERFGREAEVLDALRHPGVVRYVAHGRTDDGGAYLAMEWLDGHDLRAHLERGPLAIDEAVALARRVAEALGAAHAQGVVHRDVKPENLLLVDGQPARVKLLDLGVARLAGARSLSRAGALVGTPGYMAPEQARAERGVDARADVFSLGAVLHECIVGEPVFAGDAVAAILARVLFDAAPPLSELCDVPDALSDLVDRMLDKDPDGRPSDGSQVAAALAELGTLAPAPPRRAVPAIAVRPALTGGERRLVCVVLGRPATVDGRTSTSGDTRPGRGSNSARAPLAEVARARGADAMWLADGSFLCTLGDGSGDLAVQAARAARLALELQECAHIPLALVTTRMSEARPMGALVEQAAALLGPDVGVDAPTARLLEERFDVDFTEGRHRLRAERPAAASEPRTLLGKPTPCVGRARELATLEALFEECVEEPMGRPVLVIGDAGVGKSRLRDELLRRLAARDAEVWVGHGDPVSAGSAFGLAGRAIKRAAGLRDGAALADRRASLRAFVERRVPPEAAARTQEFLGELLGTPFDDEHSDALRAARGDRRLMADRMRRAFEDLIVACASRRPLVVVYEDLQWGDQPSVSYLDGALRILGERPLFVLALARPEVQASFPGLWAERGLERLRLEPLRRRAAGELVRAALGGAANAERIVERAAGNAFALEELIRAEAEGRGDEVPDTVLGLAEARITRLEPEARRVMRAASVFGERCWAGAAQALVGEGASAIEWLEVLIDEELLIGCTESRFPGHREVAFRHALVRDAAYAMLTEEDRTLGHRLAAAWLERAGETDALVLADHHERGGERGRAAELYLQAVRQALEAGDLAAALARADRGAACGAEGALLGALRLAQAEAHRWRGALTEAGDRAAEALELVPRGEADWFSAAGQLCLALGMRGQGELLEAGAEALLDVANAAPTQGRDRASRDRVATSAVVALARGGQGLLLVGRTELAAALLDRAEALGGPLAARDRSVAGLLEATRAMRAMEAGEHAAHLAHCLAAADAHEAAGNPRLACAQRANAGFALIELGAHERAEEVLREGLVEARRMGLRNVEAIALQNLGHALARRGHVAEGCEAQRAAIPLFREQGDRRMEGESLVYLAEALLVGGDLDAARGEARTAVDLLERAAPPLLPQALAVLARIEQARGDVVSASELAHRARALLEAEGGTLEEGEGLVRLAYAEALLARGDDDAAGDAAREAHDRLLERAAQIGDAALRESFLRSVPEHARTLELAGGR